ncbi:MAG: histidine kinase, partial [Bacteroidota bacterium]
LTALKKANENEKLLAQQKQDAEIRNLKLENRTIVIGISAGFLGVIGLLFYQRRKLKFERQQLQTQQRLLRSQMNPHFTFNTLYAIQNEIKKDQKGASDYLIKFSRLLRLILENSTENYVQLEKELEALRKYMDLQLVGASEKFSYQFHFENMDEDELIFLPPMLLQPFVENSIQHGFGGISYPGKIDIRLALEQKFIACTIEDNGRGLTNSNSEVKNSTSIRLISEFIEKATKSKVTMINKSSVNPAESGVRIQFLIPFRYTEND